MKKRTLLIVGVVLIVVGMWYYGVFETDDWSGEPIPLALGWNWVTIPDSWESTDLKAILAHSSFVTAISYIGDDGNWHTYTETTPDIINIDVTAGMSMYFYATQPTSAYGG